MGDLRVLTKDRIIERSPWVCDIAESCTFEGNGKQILASEPISICRGLIEVLLLN
jgi:hypothetical protein